MLTLFGWRLVRMSQMRVDLERLIANARQEGYEQGYREGLEFNTGRTAAQKTMAAAIAEAEKHGVRA